MTEGDDAQHRAELPVETLVADAAGIARLVRAGHEVTAEGGRAAGRLGQWSWALFEGARDPNVYFQIYIIAPFIATVMVRDPIRGQEIWGQTASIGGYITAILCPFFGAIADRGGPRKPWLALFAVLMVLSFAGTWFGVADASPGLIALVVGMVVINNVTFEFSNAFHSAMLPGIAPASRIGGLSGLAYALGSGASTLLMLIFFFAFIAPGNLDWSFIPAHPLFGIDTASHAPERLSGPISAVWMFVFALPLFLFTPDRPSGGIGWAAAMKGGIASVARTVRSLRHYRNVAHYIGARAVFNDGMTGVLSFSGIYAAGTFHYGALAMTLYGIALGPFAMLGGFLGGWLDDRLGSKRALLISIGGTALFFGLGLTMGPDRVFWFFPYEVHAPPIWGAPFFNTWPEIFNLALMDMAALSIVAGYANSRTMMARIAPIEKMTEFFGLLSMSGTAATFIAPLSVALLTLWTHSQRAGMIAVVALLVIGWAWMFKVREVRAQAV